MSELQATVQVWSCYHRQGGFITEATGHWIFIHA